MAAAEGAAFLPALDLEGVVLEVQARHPGERRHRVQALLATGAEQHQRRVHVQLGVVELGNRRGIHHVALVHRHRVGIAGGDMAEGGDVLVELHVHHPVVVERMHGPGLRLGRLDEAQRLGDRHLVDHDLLAAQRGFRYPVAGLDHRRLRGPFGGGDPGGAGEETPDGYRVGGVVGALVDHLEHVVGTEDGRGHLHAAGAPAVGQRHLAAAEGHLVAGDRHRLEQAAADHALGLLVEVGEVVALLRRGAGLRGKAHARFSWTVGCADSATPGRRSLRISSSSDWKST